MDKLSRKILKYMNSAKPDPAAKYYSWLDDEPGLEEIASAVGETAERTRLAISSLVDLGYIKSNRINFYLSNEGLSYREIDRQENRRFLAEHLWLPVLTAFISGVLAVEGFRALIKWISILKDANLP